MGELPELWTERTPEKRYLYDVEPTFGVARDAERMRQGVPPERRTTTYRRQRRERGPFVTYLRLPWSYGDRSAGDTWHKLRCKTGRHEITGGHTMQLGSATVFIERQCRWCSAPG
jgi:hypothetical protein